MYDKCTFECDKLRDYGVQSKSHITGTCPCLNNGTGDYFMVHFTNWHHVQHTCVFIYIVYIEGLEGPDNNGTFYYLQVDHQNNVTLSHCYHVPEGMLTITYSSWWLIIKSDVNTCHNTDTLSSTWVDPKVVSYEHYMECIIDAIIGRQDVSDKMNIVPKENITRLQQQNSEYSCTDTNLSLTVTNDSLELLSLLLDFREVSDSHTEHGVTRQDMKPLEKQFGHLTLQAKEF